MASDQHRILNDTDDSPIDLETSSPKPKSRHGFNDKQVKRLALVQIGFGILSVLLGIASEILSFFIRNDYYYTTLTSQFGAGIWCGAVFIVCGVIGIFAAKRKTTCMIVALLVLTIVGTVFAVLETAFGVISTITDREHIIQVVYPPTTTTTTTTTTTYPYSYDDYNDKADSDSLYNQYHSYQPYPQKFYYTYIPWGTFVTNIILAVIGVVQLGLLIASAAHSCCGTCCQKTPNYQDTGIYRTESMQPNHHNPQPMQPYIMQGGRVFYAQHGFGGNTPAGMQPVVMMPNNLQAPPAYQIVPQAQLTQQVPNLVPNQPGNPGPNLVPNQLGNPGPNLVPNQLGNPGPNLVPNQPGNPGPNLVPNQLGNPGPNLVPNQLGNPGPNLVQNQPINPGPNLLTNQPFLPASNTQI